MFLYLSRYFKASCSDIGEDSDVSKCVLVITSITLSPKFLMTETQAEDVKQTIIGKLDEAVENGCIESLLDYGHSFLPTPSPTTTPTTITSGPCKFVILVNGLHPCFTTPISLLFLFVCDSYWFNIRRLSILLVLPKNV